MEPDDLFDRYQELQQYVSWSDYDVERVRVAGPVVEPCLAGIVDDFYEEIEKHQSARIVITGGREQVRRLKQTLLQWIRELFNSNFDHSYVKRRWRAGWRHVEIGLDRMYVAAAFARLRNGLLNALINNWNDSIEVLNGVNQSLNKLLDLDLAIIEMAYQTEYVRRQQNVEALHASEERVRAIVNTAVDAIISINRQGIIQTFNPAAEKMFGYEADEAIGKNVSILMPAPLAQEHDSYIMNYLQTGNAKIIGVGRETVAKRRDGSTFPIELAISEIDHLQLFIGIIKDITDRKQIEQKLVQTERLAAIGQMIAGLAHESRNAFQRSQSCLEMLELELEGRGDQLDLVRRIQRALDHLHHLYEEVRDYAAPMNLRREMCDVAQIVQDTWAHLELMRTAKPVRLTRHIDCDAVCEVDPNAIEQVLRNVLENAIFACPDAGEIVCSCSVAALGERPALEITVRDNGPGMSAEQRDRIFDPFFTTKTKGTGLGMAIASRIVEAHGGKIAVGDNPCGAEIVITLPK